jgi:CRISPR-associated protein Cas1
VKYKGRILKWDTVVQQKTVELGRYLIGRSPQLDFSAPAPIFPWVSSREMRAKILALTSYEAKQLGIGKSTLHYLRKNAEKNMSHRLYAPVFEKLSRNGGKEH